MREHGLPPINGAGVGEVQVTAAHWLEEWTVWKPIDAGDQELLRDSLLVGGAHGWIREHALAYVRMHVAEDLESLAVERVVEGAGVSVVAGEPEGPAEVVGVIELVKNPQGAGGNALGADSLGLLQHCITSLQRS